MALSRRSVLISLLGASVTFMFPRSSAFAQGNLIEKPIPSSGQRLPVIGLGSWISFNVGTDSRAIGRVAEVIDAFFKSGGQMIDSSPMYGSAQAVIGEAMSSLDASQLFSTDKVWTSGREDGVAQIEESRQLWKVPKFSLLQVHNLVDWEVHLETLFDMKANGQLDYVGITTSHGRRHGDLADIMEHHPIDFVQLTYNMTHRSAEKRLLPIAQEKGIAVIANRPLDGGRLIRRLKKQSMPTEISELGFQNWADFVLKFVVSHPAITCAIPATSKVSHLYENMAACRGNLPDEKLRSRMLQRLASL